MVGVHGRRRRSWNLTKPCRRIRYDPRDFHTLTHIFSYTVTCEIIINRTGNGGHPITCAQLILSLVNNDPGADIMSLSNTKTHISLSHQTGVCLYVGK